MSIDKVTRDMHWEQIFTLFFSHWASQNSLRSSEALLDLSAVCSALLWQSEGVLDRGWSKYFMERGWQQRLFEQADAARHKFPFEFDPDDEERTVAPALRAAERRLVVENGTLTPDFLAYAAMDTLEHLVGLLAMSLALRNGTMGSTACTSLGGSEHEQACPAVQRVASWATGSQRHAAIWTYLVAQPKTQSPSQLWRDAAQTFPGLTDLPGFAGLHAMGHGFFHRAALPRIPTASRHAKNGHTAHTCSVPRLLHATMPMSRAEAADALRGCDDGPEPQHRSWCAGGFFHNYWRTSRDLGEAVARRVSAAGGDRRQAGFRDECVGMPFEDVCFAHADNLAGQKLSNRPARYEIAAFPFLAPNSLGTGLAWGDREGRLGW